MVTTYWTPVSKDPIHELDIWLIGEGVCPLVDGSVRLLIEVALVSNNTRISLTPVGVKTPRIGIP
jgi:hypothetical protein